MLSAYSEITGLRFVDILISESLPSASLRVNLKKCKKSKSFHESNLKVMPFTALSRNFYRSNRLIFRLLITPLTNITKNVHNSDSQNSEIDALDSFTTQLLQKKTDKWENIRVKRKLNYNKPTVLKITLNKSDADNLAHKIRNYNENQINDLIYECLELVDNKKLILITNYCIEYKICPTPINLQRILSFFARSGDKDTIKRIQEFIKEVNPHFYNINAKFLHYLAEATWVKGNISESLKLFEEVYKDYLFLRRKLKLMIKYLIINVISERSEAILVLMINFTENIAAEYDDYFPLACVWQACFISEWYADQCRATEILDKHEKLCEHLSNRIPYVVNTALRNHQTEVVHRLLELLLKYNMKSHYTFVLQSLFNYRYWQNDLRSCAEIIQWSIDADVPLLTSQHEQFISLLLNQDIRDSTKVLKKHKPPPDFQLKF